MNKIVFPAILVATIMVAGAFAFMPVEQASTVHLSGTVLANAVTGSVQSLTGAGAADITNTITNLTTTGADAITLANGVAGQVKIITLVVDGGDATITPTLLAGTPTTIVFQDAGDGVVLVWTPVGWLAVGNNGGLIS